MQSRRMRGGGESKAHEATGMMRWLLTYADMLTLLFVVFVVMYAISQVNEKKLQEVSDSIQKAMGAKLSEAQIKNIIKDAVNESENKVEIDKQQQSLDELHKNLISFLKEHKLDKSVEVKKEKRGLVVLLQTDNVLFDTGRAELRSQTKQVLQEFARLVKLAKLENLIRIEGHTDNVPLAGGEYKDNWGLSVSRAASVLRFLIDKNTGGLNPKQFEVAGLGEHRPLALNDTETNRQKNRRVELIILTQKEEKEEVKEKLNNQK